ALKAGIKALTRQALHAGGLSFLHPQSGERLVFTAPIPEDMGNLLALFRQATPGHPGQTGLQTWQDQLKG
ncbi:MAG TPA: RNA pseudouridine synthase, partial [Syntrophaceae bacterium]|nr:RNA pseudouridine synthase [Syntrophaceae bacterium]